MIVAAIAVNVIPGVGQVLSAAMISAITMAGVGAAVGMATSMLGPKKTGVSGAQQNRTVASADPTTPRKWWFGDTAGGTDIRYEEFTGTNQEYFHRVMVSASHRIGGYDEIWFDKELAWSAAGGVVGKYAGYLTVATRTEGSAANVITGISSRYGNSRRFTGLAYLHLRFKTTGNSKKAESPFAQAIPSAIVVRGRGCPVYDPRLDGTQPGGVGPQRANDPTTWAYDAGQGQGNNPALQLLTYLLGWRINGFLVLGCGVPADRIDVASFMAAANACDEPVALAGGGTEKRYRSAGMFSDADDPTGVFQALNNSMNGMLRDAGGRFSLTVLKNDLATPRATFTDDDILSNFEWAQTPPLHESFNEVRGRCTFADNSSLYTMLPYPPQSVASPDGINRPFTLDLPLVQSISQAQRLAKQMLQRNLYRGLFRCELSHRGYLVQLGDVAAITFAPLGWVNKLFRVVEHTIRQDGVVPVMFQEEHEAIYSWDKSEVAPVVLAQPATYDYMNNPLIQAVDDASLTAEWPGVLDPDGTKPEDNATEGAPNGTPVGDRLAEDVTSAIDSGTATIAAHGLTLNEILVDVGDLTTVFGDTVSASNSANAASLSASAAAAAEGQAVAARNAAQAARDLAQTARTDAEAARQDALAQASAASGSASAASGSATVAQGHSGSASASAGLALQYRDSASGFSSAASTSSSVAAGYSTAALNSLAATRPPALFDATGSGFTSVINSNSSPALNPTLLNLANGRWGYLVDPHTPLVQAAPIPAIDGRVYEVEVEFEAVGAESSYILSSGLSWLNAAGALISNSNVFTTYLTGGGRGKSVTRWSNVANSARGVLAWGAGAVTLKAYGTYTYNFNPPPGASMRILGVKFTDITALVNGETQASAAAASSSSAAASNTTAGQQAAAASQSATNASTSAALAGTRADNASASATNAAGSSSTASTASTTSATARDASIAARDASIAAKDAAAASASAASTSASQASASNTTAGQRATAAQDSATTASTHAGNAGVSASNSATSASSAAGSASAALSNVTLAAQSATSSQNKNPNFIAFTNPASIPDGWQEWVAANATRSRQVGENGAGYAWQEAVPANLHAGISQNALPVSPGWWVLEADVNLVSGTLHGAGLHCGSVQGLPAVNLHFHTDPDTTGAVQGDGVVGRTYRFRKLVEFGAAARSINFHLMTGWNSGFAAGSAAKSLRWYRAAIRPASQAEIEARAATVSLSTISASVSTQAAAITTLQGRALSYWQQTTNAGSVGTFIEARSEATFGAGASSNVSIGARQVHIFNEVSGSWRRALSISGGDVIIHGNLTAEAGIFLGSGQRWRVQYAASDFAVEDGQVVSYGANLGNTPKIDFQRDNLKPLAAGEAYNLYAENPTATGFTARLKISTPGAAGAYAVTNDEVGTMVPAGRQVARGANPEANNLTYSFEMSGTFTNYAYYVGGGEREFSQQL